MNRFITVFSKKYYRNIIIIVLFFITAPIALISSLFSLSVLAKSSKVDINKNVYENNINSGAQIYASLPSSFPGISDDVVAADARVKLIRKYLITYDSPLASLSELIVQTADKNNIDYRLVTAIAQQESNLCKHIPPESYNCWGWGIHSQGTLHFSSFEEGIEVVSKGLKEDYVDKGFNDPDKIMQKYTPLSPGSWAEGVNLFMSQME